MRVLTRDEVAIVGGGGEMEEIVITSSRINARPTSIWDMRWGDFGSYASDALQGWADDNSEHWWDGAFSVLEHTIETVSHFLPEPIKSYVEGLAKVPEIGKQTADTIWNRKNYDNYVIDEQSNGDEPLTFEQWRATRGGK
jgi:hypothetical protein